MHSPLHFESSIDINDSNIFVQEQIEKFINDIEFCSELSKNTVKTYKFAVRTIAKRLREMEPINTINFLNATPDQIKQAFYMDPSSKAGTRSGYSIAVKTFYDYLYNNGLIGIKLSEQITIKYKRQQQLPNFLSEKEINTILEMANIDNSPVGIRNRAILHLLYATGIRNAELREIKLRSIDWENCHIKILGKGSKERLVPFYEEAKRHLIDYIENARPHFAVTNPKNPHLFITRKYGYKTQTKIQKLDKTPMCSQNLSNIIKKYAAAVNNIDVSPHWFRHSYATHLVNNGANLRAVQELMGHSKLGTTAIYLHVTMNQLKDEHNKFHPRAGMR